MEGFIKLHRKILEWEWYDDPNTMRLFIHILLKANYTEKKWRGNLVQRGQFITSLSKLSDETGLSVQNVRTSIERLKTTGEITSQSTSEYTILEVINYSSYQGEITSELTNNQQTDNKQVTTTKNTNKEKKEKKTETSVFISEFSEAFQSKYLEWVEYRKQSKKKLTHITIEKQLAKCREWGEQNAIKSIDKSIERQWQGLFPYEDDEKKPQKPNGIDYEAEKKKTLEREKLAESQKKKEQDDSDRKKREDDNILRWLDSLPESRLRDIEKEINESPLVSGLRPPNEEDPEEEQRRKNAMIKTARHTARILIARKHYFNDNP